MALTTKPTSTISYNSPDWLRDKLDALYNARRIADYRMIRHIGEDGDKDHFHVWLEPSRRLDTEDLREWLKEPDPMHPDKPLGCMPFRSSKEDDWIMYALHDPEYLSNHHTDESEEKEPYTLDDIVTPNPEALQRSYKRAIRLRQTDTQRIVDRLMDGVAPSRVAYELGNPFAVNTLARLLDMDNVHGHRSPAIVDLGPLKAVEVDDKVEVIEQLGWKDRNASTPSEGWIDMDAAGLIAQINQYAADHAIVGYRLRRVYKAFEGDYRAVFTDVTGREHRFFLVISQDGKLTEMEERI